jgi:hypothetical protein
LAMAPPTTRVSRGEAVLISKCLALLPIHPPPDRNQLTQYVMMLCPRGGKARQDKAEPPSSCFQGVCLPVDVVGSHSFSRCLMGHSAQTAR